jgi:hypothetical protein
LRQRAKVAEHRALASSPPRTHLGDSHNFGRRVTLRGGRVLKPRALLWEWLLLAADSPLRRVLRVAAEQEGFGTDGFEFLPRLRFARERTLARGEVERVSLTPLRALSKAQKRELAAIVGRSVALFAFLGVADLHWENLVLGADAHGRIVFGPLDVEMILADFSLPTQTKLLPDADPEYAAICQHACGVRRVLPYLGKPIAADHLLEMASAYRKTLALLERHAGSIAKVFDELEGLRETPIRVCLRGTGEYVQAGAELWPPLLEAEVAQLSRGDIPYFFRWYGTPGIYFFTNRALTERKRLPLTGDVPRLDPLLSLARGLRSPSRKRLREEGLFALLGAFDHPSLSGRHGSDELEVRFGKKSMTVTPSSGEELESDRDLSAFVSSVYSPCRCGEVRSVLVPQVTKCRPR